VAIGVMFPHYAQLKEKVEYKRKLSEEE